MINVAEKMKQLYKLSKRFPDERIKMDLWELLVNPIWLTQAWEEIRGNRGSSTAGIDNKTAVDIDLNLINKLAEELRTKKYRPKPVKRVYIPKANGKTRPLGIPTIKDRIVQQGLKMLLEPIFEADFLDCSHGFRQGRSTHTALRDVVRKYSGTSWIIEGDIEGCFDNISHGILINQIKRRIADENILQLIWRFLEAGYLEEWQYNRTYSGTPQGGIASPLLTNIFLHQLDEMMMIEFNANRIQSKQEENARRNPEYLKIANKITKLRKQLKEANGEVRRTIIKNLKKLERELKHISYYAKDKRILNKIGYVRYSDDFVILVNGNKIEAETIRNKVKEKLSSIGLKLSEHKTKITHWNKPVKFLGYQIKGKMRSRGIGIRAVLSIPQEKYQKIKDAIKGVGSYYHIPEVDIMTQISAMYRGWCNYYRYARSPQKTFNKLASNAWWIYAHFIARKQKSSIAKTIKREKKAGRLTEIRKGSRKKITFQIQVGKKQLILDIFPPKTEQIRSLENKGNWKVDLKPIQPLNWQSGRSLTTRLEAIERANGVCERCKERPVDHVHHTVPIKAKSFLARVMSDQSQRYSARALCKECHLDVHGGSFKRNKQQSGGNAGYAERCLSGVGSAT